MAETVTFWRGELLWPQALPSGSVIDLSQVVSLGTWAHAWFRDHPGQAVVGVSPALKRQFTRAGLPVLWYDSRRLPIVGGVSVGEKSMLWGS
jgi:hypothetical protein